jgi:hypothetical protein
VIGFLLVVGLQLYLTIDTRLVRPGFVWMGLGLCALACQIPPLGRALDRWSNAGRWADVVGLALIPPAGALFLLWSAAIQDRQFVTIYHDEFSYLLQARMLTAGRLWMPAHPLADFLDSFYVLVRPVYASQYFPGTAFWLAPGLLAGWPEWVMPLLGAAASLGLLFLLLREFFDRVTATLGVLVVVSLPLFRLVSIMSLSQVPALLTFLASAWLLMLGMRLNRPWLGLPAGLFAGWMLLTRPLDGACLLAPWVLWLALKAIRRTPDRPSVIRTLIAGLIPLLGAGLLQLWVNHNVTGSALKSPFSLYAERDHPGAEFGFHRVSRDARPATAVPQKQVFYENSVRPLIESHTPAQALRSLLRERPARALRELLPDGLLLLLLPVGLFLLRDREWLFVAGAGLFMAAYACYVFNIVHYDVVLAPAMAVVLASAVSRIGEAGSAWRRFLLLSVAWLSVSSWPQFNRTLRDLAFDSQLQRDVAKALESIRDPQAAVLFRFPTDGNPEEEVVYNIEREWPDDCRIVRLHDLGDRNTEAFLYFAQIQPSRVFYHYDRATGVLQRLGTAAELAEPILRETAKDGASDGG